MTPHRTLRRAGVVVAVVSLAALFAGWAATSIRIDMSFEPTFSTEPRLVDATDDHRSRFGDIGFQDLAAVVEVHDLHDHADIVHVAELADRLRRLDHVVDVRDPTAIPLFDRAGRFVPASLRDPQGRLLEEGPEFDARMDDLLASRQLRRTVVADDERHVAVTATIDLPRDDFRGRRHTVEAFSQLVDGWSAESALAASVTGYPVVEQVYAHEVTVSVLLVIGLLYVVMVAVLQLYFRRVRDTIACLVGVTAAVPFVLAEMRLLGQPFSIVNSQVLTLVVIVGVAQALHHIEAYRRHREDGLDHTAANQATLRSLAFPAGMTALSTMVGFLALTVADMPAVRSFGLATGIGVATVYVLNWLLVPRVLDLGYARGAGVAQHGVAARATSAVLCRAAALVDRRPGRIVVAFALVTAGALAWGLPSLSVDQRVNEELDPGHEAVVAQRLVEDQFTGFLGPELWLRPTGGDLLEDSADLARLVNAVCELPDVRAVISPLDLVSQPPLTPAEPPCRRDASSLDGLRTLTQGPPDGAAQLFRSVLGPGDRGDVTVVIRTRDIGTARTLPFVDQVEDIAERTLGPDVDVVPVGPWWLAQNGMDRLSTDVGLSALTALAIIVPIVLLALRERRLCMAAMVPTLMPMAAALAFMGAAGITLRIGTAMILAITLGLAADDTIYLFHDVRRRTSAGSGVRSSLTSTLRRSGRPAVYSSIVLVSGLMTMLPSRLAVLREMGLVAAVTMTVAVASDILLGPAVLRLLDRRPPTTRPGDPDGHHDTTRHLRRDAGAYDRSTPDEAGDAKPTGRDLAPAGLG